MINLESSFQFGVGNYITEDVSEDLLLSLERQKNLNLLPFTYSGDNSVTFSEFRANLKALKWTVSVSPNGQHIAVLMNSKILILSQSMRYSENFPKKNSHLTGKVYWTQNSRHVIVLESSKSACYIYSNQCQLLVVVPNEWFGRFINCDSIVDLVLPGNLSCADQTGDNLKLESIFLIAVFESSEVLPFQINVSNSQCSVIPCEIKGTLNIPSISTKQTNVLLPQGRIIECMCTTLWNRKIYQNVNSSLLLWVISYDSIDNKVLSNKQQRSYYITLFQATMQKELKSSNDEYGLDDHEKLFYTNKMQWKQLQEISLLRGHNNTTKHYLHNCSSNATTASCTASNWMAIPSFMQKATANIRDLANTAINVSTGLLLAGSQKKQFFTILQVESCPSGRYGESNNIK